MSSRVVVLVILGGVALLGLIRAAGALWAWRRRKRFAATYLARFRALVTAYDAETYDWLVHRSSRMQEQLGGLGLSARAPTPYEPWPVPDTPVLTTTLPELRGGKARPDVTDPCEDLLVRHLGTLDDERTRLLKRLANPITWLGEGVRLLLVLPVLLLHWLGLARPATVERIEESLLFRMAAGLALILGLAAAGLVLALGGPAARAFLQEGLNALRALFA